MIGHRPIPKHAANEMYTSSQVYDNLITLKLSSNPLNCTNLALLNTRSIRNKMDFITDYICEHDLDIIALTETWLTDDPKDTANTSKLTPEGYSFVHLPRSDRQGGGVGVLYKSCINMIFSRPWPASSFQCLEVMFGTPSSVTRLLLVYRPPSTGRRGVSFRTFMAEFTNLLEFFTAQLTGLIILGDFNIHYGKAGNKDSNDFFDLLHATNLQQHVRRPTHTIGNILDFVITPPSGSVVTSVTVGSLLTDHHAVHCLLQAPMPDRTKKQISYRKYAAINSTKFRSDFELSFF